MYNRQSTHRGLIRLWTWVVLVCMLCVLPCVASARTVAAKVNKKAAVYQKPSTASRVVAKASRGNKLYVTAIKGKWARIKVGGKTGYMLKSAVTKASAKTAGVSASTTAAVQSKISYRDVQKRLTEKGYLKSVYVSGKKNSQTTKALRIFQMMNSLTVNGKANESTIKRLFSSKARAKRSVSMKKWSASGIDSAFRKRGVAVLIDLKTGTRIRIRRVGGHNHLDVEPKTASDTAKLKKCYGGEWSWDSRPVLLIASGKCFAAAMNGYPHGAQISHSNNFEGQFCVHLNGSTTHGTEKANSYHQSNVRAAYSYLR